MFDVCILLLILLQSHDSNGLHVPNVNETELKFTFFVHRHGDRTPLNSNFDLSNNYKEFQKIDQRYGYGELTQRGIETSYKLGQFIRRRYGGLLSHKYKPRERYVRTTFCPRTVTTAMVSIAASYYLDLDSWTDVMNWIPLPYYTVIPKYDYNAAFANCPTYMKSNNDIMDRRPLELEKFQGLFENLSTVLPFNISRSPLMIYDLYDLLVSETHLGLQLDKLEQQLVKQIKEATDVAADVSLGNETYISLQAGVLLHQFIKSASRVIEGKSSYKMQQFSAHDFNVYSFEAVTQVTPRQGYPEYGSLLALELRWNRCTDIYYVLPVYLSAPGKQEKYLHIKGCGENVLCEFSKFVQITGQYSLNINEWRQKCGFNYKMPFPVDFIE